MQTNLTRCCGCLLPKSHHSCEFQSRWICLSGDFSVQKSQHYFCRHSLLKNLSFLLIFEADELTSFLSTLTENNLSVFLIFKAYSLTKLLSIPHVDKLFLWIFKAIRPINTLNFLHRHSECFMQVCIVTVSALCRRIHHFCDVFTPHYCSLMYDADCDCTQKCHYGEFSIQTN